MSLGTKQHFKKKKATKSYKIIQGFVALKLNTQACKQDALKF